MVDKLYNTKQFYEKLQKEINSSKNIEIFSAYIKLKALKELTKDINKNAEVTIVARWQYNDLISNASDLEVFNYCKSKNWRFGIDITMHQKIYRFNKDIVLLGSNNLTLSGLGLTKNENTEAGTVLHIKDDNALNQYYKNILWLDEHIFNQLSKELKKGIKNKSQSDWSKEVKELFEKPISFLFTYDFPEEYPNISSNINFMTIINNDIKNSFLNSKIYKWLYQNLRNNSDKFTSFGWLSAQAHNDIINIPPPYRKEVKKLLENLMEWVKEFSSDIEVISYKHTKSYRIKGQVKS